MEINGARLKMYRELKKVTRAELAEVADVSHVRIWQIEKGVCGNVNTNIAKAMAEFLKVPLSELR
jgi:transcriptional regulator with XRE-family HTH domain